MRSRRLDRTLVTALALASAAPAVAQSAGDIVSQPARDVGLSKREIPPVLQRAAAAPYSRTGTATCAQLRTRIAALTEAVGPDFTADRKRNERSLASIAGSAVVNSVIPFRGLVREVSGAAGAQREREAAILTGVARRGFLRGIQAAKGCSR